MAQTNLKRLVPRGATHEGSAAHGPGDLTAEQMLRRSVMSCLLWEGEFYEDGEKIADRITRYAREVAADHPGKLARIAVEARSRFNLRHAPLLLLDALSEHQGPLVGDTIAEVVQRVDEAPELLSIYWRNGRKPVSHQVRRGLGEAMRKFDEYQLAKYDRAKRVTLRDVLRVCHPVPRDKAEGDLWRRVTTGTLKTPDTWETRLSAGEDKCRVFTELLEGGKLGYMALLRNLRNMAEVGVDEDLIRHAIISRKGAQRVLPMRYVSAARAAPQFEPAIDEALCATIDDLPVLPGRTVVVVDVSGSMSSRMSARSEMTRRGAAAALASIVPGDVRLFTFSDKLVECPPRRGMAGVDAIERSQPWGATYFHDAVDQLNREVPYDRLIVLTDEQSHDFRDGRGWMGKDMSGPKGRGYVVNVASSECGVGYGPWVHVDGFSESVLRYIHELEGHGDRVVPA